MISVIPIGGKHCTESWSHLGAKLRDQAVRLIRDGCYSWAALSLIDSNTLYTIWLFYPDYTWFNIKARLDTDLNLWISLDILQNWTRIRDGVGAKEGRDGLVIHGSGPSGQETISSLREFAGNVNAK